MKERTLNSMINRNNAFSMIIQDPEQANDISPILKFLSIGEDLIIFKTDGIYRMLTAEKIDPNATNLETKHSYEKLYSIGTSSPYVARIIIQFEKILNLISNEESNKREIITYLWNTNKLLLDSYMLVDTIIQQINPLSLKCDKIIEANKNKSDIPSLPKIPYLENQVRTFLNNSKLLLIEIFRSLHIFFNMPMSDRKCAHFDKHIKWLENTLGKEHPISNMLNHDITWIQILSESRNAIEHPNKGQKLYIYNFKLQPGNKFSQPTWSYDLTKKLGIKSDPTDLANDLKVYIDNIFTLFEEIILLIISDKLKEHKLLTLYKISEETIDKQCPINYQIGLKNSL